MATQHTLNTSGPAPNDTEPAADSERRAVTGLAPFLRRLRRSQNGSTLVEFALTTGVMLTLVCVLMELGLALYSYGMISESAREGTRYAIVRGSTCQNATGGSCTASATTINSYVKNLGYPNLGGSALNVSTTWPDTTGNCTTSNAPGCRVKVAITYTFLIRIPLVPTNSLSFSTASEMYILQ